MSRFTLARYFDLTSSSVPRIFADLAPTLASPLERLDVRRLTFRHLNKGGDKERDKDRAHFPITSSLPKGAALKTVYPDLVNQWMGLGHAFDGVPPKSPFTVLTDGQHVSVNLVSEVAASHVYVHLSE